MINGCPLVISAWLSLRQGSSSWFVLILTFPKRLQKLFGSNSSKKKKDMACSATSLTPWLKRLGVCVRPRFFRALCKVGWVGIKTVFWSLHFLRLIIHLSGPISATFILSQGMDNFMLLFLLPSLHLELLAPYNSRNP